MKKAIVGILALLAATSAFASGGLSGAEAQKEVIKVANTYVSKNAPDFGGKVKTPAQEEREGDRLTVTVTGVADVTMAGDGDMEQPFSCVGEFVQANDGLFYQVGKIHCEDKR